ncbi:MAG: sugar phosphate isomerase/epimerase [Planctomycetota bacterium]|nr:sugar phosphate isomerase/epimerase [Planctomycetota bacterium]
MVSSCVTISLVEATRGGPFVFWDDLAEGCRRAKELGFDAVEVFAAGPDAVDPAALKQLLDDSQLELAALGTGAGWVVHQLQLCDPDTGRRQAARDFIRAMIDTAAGLGAFAIIGSMQGRYGDGVDQPTALSYLSDALNELGLYAQQYGVPLVYEPLNRYETNLVNTLAQGVQLLDALDTDNVRLLADLFHMNIEERDIAAAIREAGPHVGHIHFVDSNRRAAGMGHLDFAPIVAAVQEIDYNGYLCAEALPLPTSEDAARQTIQTFQRYF